MTAPRRHAAIVRGLVILAIEALACSGCSVTTPSPPASGSRAPSSVTGSPVVATATASVASATPTSSPVAAWVRVTGMTRARTWQSATTLPDGRVLVAGGLDLASLGDDPTATRTTELFDQGTGSWTAGPSMHSARQGHSATLLADGRVLVVGGRGSAGGTFLDSAEVFDPATNAWTSVAPAPRTPGFHTATLLGDGRVLVIGDNTPEGSVSGVVEAYDPAKGAWTVLPSYATLAGFHTATLLRDGTVLVEGGAEVRAELPSPEAQAARFDPATNRWSKLPDMHAARSDHAAGRLADGRVLVVGFDASTGEPSAEVFDPATTSWTPVAAPPVPAVPAIIGAALSDGGVVAVAMDASGAAPASAAVFDGSSWQMSPGLADIAEACIVALPGGRALLIGGEDDKGSGGSPRSLSTTYLLDATGR